MKKILIVLSLINVSSFFSQLVSYVKIHDQPVFPKVSLNLDFVNMDANFGNFDNLTFNIGAWGYVALPANLEVQFNVQKSYLTLGKLLNKSYVGNTELNVGSAYFLKEFSRTENVKMILSQKTSYDGRYTLTNYIEVPAKATYKLGIEGGFHFRSSPYDCETDFYSEKLNMTNIGFYVGPVLKRSTSAKITLENGNKTALNSANWEFFLDGLFLPVNSFKVSETDVKITDATRDLIKQNPLGFRCGARMYQADKKENTGKRFGLCYSASFGKKPYQGWFMAASLGMTILKKH